MPLEPGNKVKVALPLPKAFHKAKWNEHMELMFSGCDVNLEMLVILRDSTDTLTVKKVDSDGDIRFEEIPYTWPPELFQKEKR